MSVRPSGLAYIWTYPGAINLLEEVLNVTVVTFLILSGFCYRGYFLGGVVCLALIGTGIFIVVHVSGHTKKSKWPWHWIECVYVLIFAILLAVASTASITVFTRGYIITGVTGYILAMVYFVDTLDKYQLAITPQPKYAWTRPDMPELN